MTRMFWIKIFIYLCIATTINVIAYVLKSDFISSFPGADFLTIVLALLAINIGTSSYIVSKLEEMSNKVTFKFNRTYTSIKNAIREQIILVIISFILLVVRSSKYLKDYNDDTMIVNLSILVDIFLTTIFIIVISILWDTGKSIFLLVKNDGEKK